MKQVENAVVVTAGISDEQAERIHAQELTAELNIVGDAALSNNVNTNKQFYDWIHQEEVQEKIEIIRNEVAEELEGQLSDPRLVEIIERLYKEKMAKAFNIFASNTKRVRIMVRASIYKDAVEVSFYPKWLPRKASEFANIDKVAVD